MDSSRIIGVQQNRNICGIQSQNKLNAHESIGRLLYFQENQKKEGIAILVSNQHIITPIINILSLKTKQQSQKDSFVFQTAFGQYIGIKEIFFEKNLIFDEWNEDSIVEQQYCTYSIMLLEQPINNIEHSGIIHIKNYSEFLSNSCEKNILMPYEINKKKQIYKISQYEINKNFLVFDKILENEFKQQCKLLNQVPIFVNDDTLLGGICLIGFAYQSNQEKFSTWLLTIDNIYDIHSWLNGNNQSFTVEYAIDSNRGFKSKELKDCKGGQAHNGRILYMFKLEQYYVASCSEDKQIKVWNWRTGRIKKIFKTDRACKILFGISEYLIGVEGNMMIIINWKNKKVENISTHSTQISFIQVITESKYNILLLDDKNKLYLYQFQINEKSFKIILQLNNTNLDVNNTIISCIFIKKKDQQIVLTGQNGIINIYNYKKQIVVKNLNTQNQINTIIIHPSDSNQLIFGGDNGIIYFWNISRDQMTHKINISSNIIAQIAFINKEFIIINNQNDYFLLNLTNFQYQVFNSRHLYQINSIINLDDFFFLTSDIAGKIRLWQLEQQDEGENRYQDSNNMLLQNSEFNTEGGSLVQENIILNADKQQVNLEQIQHLKSCQQKEVPQIKLHQQQIKINSLDEQEKASTNNISQGESKKSRLNLDRNSNKNQYSSCINLNRETNQIQDTKKIYRVATNPNQILQQDEEYVENLQKQYHDQNKKDTKSNLPQIKHENQQQSNKQIDLLNQQQELKNNQEQALQYEYLGLIQQNGEEQLKYNQSSLLLQNQPQVQENSSQFTQQLSFHQKQNNQHVNFGIQTKNNAQSSFNTSSDTSFKSFSEFNSQQNPNKNNYNQNINCNNNISKASEHYLQQLNNQLDYNEEQINRKVQNYKNHPQNVLLLEEVSQKQNEIIALNSYLKEQQLNSMKLEQIVQTLTQDQEILQGKYNQMNQQMQELSQKQNQYQNINSVLQQDNNQLHLRINSQKIGQEQEIQMLKQQLEQRNTIIYEKEQIIIQQNSLLIQQNSNNILKEEQDKYQSEQYEQLQENYSGVCTQNAQLLRDIDKLKSDLKNKKESLDHWIKQYYILLEKEKLSKNNLQLKEQLINLLKNEIQKIKQEIILQSASKVQKQHQNCNTNPNKDTQEEWSSIFYQIDTESVYNSEQNIKKYDKSNTNIDKKLIQSIENDRKNTNQQLHYSQYINYSTNLQNGQTEKEAKNSNSSFSNNNSFKQQNTKNQNANRSSGNLIVKEQEAFKQKQQYEQYQQESNSPLSGLQSLKYMKSNICMENNTNKPIKNINMYKNQIEKANIFDYQNKQIQQNSFFIEDHINQQQLFRKNNDESQIQNAQNLYTSSKKYSSLSPVNKINQINQLEHKENEIQTQSYTLKQYISSNHNANNLKINIEQYNGQINSKTNDIPQPNLYQNKSDKYNTNYMPRENFSNKSFNPQNNYQIQEDNSRNQTDRNELIKQDYFVQKDSHNCEISNQEQYSAINFLQKFNHKSKQPKAQNKLPVNSQKSNTKQITYHRHNNQAVLSRNTNNSSSPCYKIHNQITKNNAINEETQQGKNQVCFGFQHKAISLKNSFKNKFQSTEKK